MKNQYRVNDQIRARDVRVVSDGGAEVMPARKALHRRKYPNGLIGPGLVTFSGQGRHLHIGQSQPHRAGGRDNQQKEDDDSETSDEVGGRPPEQQAVRQDFDISQYSSTGRGIA